MTKIKICGIYRDEDAEYINEFKPDYFGMVIDFPKSHRNVSPKRASEIRELIDKEISAVGVFVNDDLSKIEILLKNGVIDIAQLHGNETEEDIQRLQKRTGKPVWKAFKVRSEADIQKAAASPADLILLDNGYGTGEAFDWNLIKDAERDFALAGGIDPENIAEAIKQINPFLIDLSSGVETDKKKDREKIRSAVMQAHDLGRR